MKTYKHTPTISALNEASKKKKLNFLDLQNVFSKLGCKNIIGLEKAIIQLQESGYCKEIEKNSFVCDVIPYICKWALDWKNERKIKILSSTNWNNECFDQKMNMYTQKIHFKRKEIRSLLSHMFFLNLTSFDAADDLDTDEIRLGTVDLSSLYGMDDAIAIERLKCFLHYFYEEWKEQSSGNESKDRTISFNLLKMDKLPNWKDLTNEFNSSSICNVHVDRMEKSDAIPFVDFANKALQIHRIIPSMTQEEVLFSCCPEAFPGLLFCDVMKDDEAIIISGVKRYCDYEGYSHTFRYTGGFECDDENKIKEVDIIAIDAVVSGQFREKKLLRDLNKAYLAFYFISQMRGEGTKISTGFWGCGVFGGDRDLKFLQQICASLLAGVKLDFSVFGDHETQKHLKGILLKIVNKKLQIKELFKIFHEYGLEYYQPKKICKESFHQRIINKLDM